MNIYKKEGIEMETIFKVEAMSCGHCEARVNKEIAELGATSVVDLATKEVTVTHDATITDAAIIQAIDAAGFDAEKV